MLFKKAESSKKGTHINSRISEFCVPSEGNSITKE